MKIFVIDRPVDSWDPLWDKALEADAAPRPDILPLTMGADSALVRQGFPCFLPDFARDGWELRLAPVLRVSRLGKWIEPRFAHRYIDAVTIAAILRPAPPVPLAPVREAEAERGTAEPAPGGPFPASTLPPDCGEAEPSREPARGCCVERAAASGPSLPFLPVFDGAITPGAFIPFPLPPGASIRAAANGGESVEFPLSAEALRAPETLALISRSTTLKSGDLIIPAMLPAAFPARVGLDIAASLATESPEQPQKPLMRARVK